VILPEMMECWNKTEWKQIKLLLGKKKLDLYYAWGEEYYENPKNAGQLDLPRMDKFQGHLAKCRRLSFLALF
jgi:hypothetical protein